MRYDDLAAAEQLMEGDKEKERIRYIVNKLAQQTMRGSLTAHWWLPLNGVSYTGSEEASKANADNLYLARLHPYRSINP